MKDALRSKIHLVLLTALAFAAGLGVAAELGVTQTGAADVRSASLQLAASSDRPQELGDVSFENGFAPIVDAISGAVVTLNVEKAVQSPRQRFNLPDDFFPFPRREEEEDSGEPRLQPGSGSGFIIDEEGYILTNNHVVQNAENISVRLADRRQIDDVQVVGRDPQTDVALLKIDAPDLTSVPLGDSDALDVGEWVLAIGSPGFESAGGGTVLESTITAGIVSAKGRSIDILTQQSPLAIEDFIQTDAVINRGNSGGPLVNMQGEVVGMSTAIMSNTGSYQGYGFAVPTTLIRHVVDDLMQYGEVRRAVLGVVIENVTAADARLFELDEVRGVEIADFSELSEGGSPARDAGVQRGDLVLSVDGEAVQGVSDLQTKIRAYSPGETVTLGLARREDGETRRLEVDVTLGAAQSGEEQQTAEDDAGEAERNPLGIDVQELTPDLRSKIELPDDVTGVVVTDHAGRRSPLVSALGGIAMPPQGATIITRIGGRDLQGMEGYREIVSELEPGSLTRVQVFLRGPNQQQFTFVTVEIPDS